MTPLRSVICDRTGSSKTPQYLVTLAATLLIFSGGATLGWSSPALHMFNQPNSTLPFHPSTTEASWIGSVLSIGALVGALPAGLVADLLGRKLSMLLLTAPLILSWVIIVFAKTIPLLYAARFFAGAAVGASCAIVPMYISEIAETSIRGRLGSSFQLMFCGGVLFTYSVGAITSYYNMAIACAGIPIVFILVFFQAPETPIYLMKRGHKTEAAKILKYLRGDQCNVDKELQAIENELASSSASSVSFLQALARRETRLAVTISVGLMVFQQISGINIFVAYAADIFDSVGVTLDPQVCAILIGLAEIFATSLSLALIERVGRKIILQISSSVMAVSLVILGYYFMLKERGEDVSPWSTVPLVAIIIYILFYSIGLGPVPWIMTGDVLTDDVKGVFAGIAVCVSGLLGFIITFSFQSVVNIIGNAVTYWLLAGGCTISLLFCTFVVIETKGKSSQEIQEKLAGKSEKDVGV